MKLVTLKKERLMVRYLSHFFRNYATPRFLHQQQQEEEEQNLMF